jgi:hypothetical protein
MLLLLAGCATAAPQPQIVHICPPIKTYTPAFEHQAATELAALPADSAVAVLVEEDIALRRAAKDCLK